MKKVAIIQFPGSNCEAESAAAIRRNGMQPVEFLWNGNPGNLADMDGFFLVGGFSYEDRSRAGVIASLDPVLDAIRREAEKGKPVLGVCNGAQILVESGMVPGAVKHRTALSLARNDRGEGTNFLGTGFYNDWCRVGKNPASKPCAFTMAIQDGTSLRIPFAHAEGRFLALPEWHSVIEKEGLGVLQYVDEEGEVGTSFPVNPNGSLFSMAAVANASGNVMAMMPHPERTKAGDSIFASMREYMESGLADGFSYRELDVPTQPQELQPGEWDDEAHVLSISMIITDTAAKSVEQCLSNKGFSVQVERRMFWKLKGESFPHDWEAVLTESGELFNPNKEYIDTSSFGDSGQTAVLRVSPREDPEGVRIRHTLHHRFHLDYIQSVRKSVLWILRFPDAESKEKQLPAILDTHILHSPVADHIEDISHWDLASGRVVSK